jgi:hypothetical protein
MRVAMDRFSIKSVPILNCSCVMMSPEAAGIGLLSIQKNHNNPWARRASQAARTGREDLLVTKAKCGSLSAERLSAAVVAQSASL